MKSIIMDRVTSLKKIAWKGYCHYILRVAEGTEMDGCVNEMMSWRSKNYVVCEKVKMEIY